MPVFEELDLAVTTSEIVVVVGPSGSGKSTLVRILLGLEDPDDGEAWLLGRRIDALTSRRRATVLREVGVGFQDPLLDNARTVLENLVALGRINHRFDENKSDDVERLSSVVDGFGLSELLDRQSSVLSGGQKLRVALGRALVAQPRLLLLDEPTHMVDPAGKADIYRELEKLIRAKGLSALIVSHDDEACAISDRIVEVANHRRRHTSQYHVEHRESAFQEGTAFNWVPRVVPEPPSDELFRVGSVTFADGPAALSLGIADDRLPAQIKSAVVRDCYVDAWSVGDQADMVAIEAELDRHARERRIAGAWERTPGTAYRLDGAAAPAEAPSEWGDPVASERFWRLMASPGCDAWRTLVPSAAALLYLADPWHTNRVETPAGSVPLDHCARRGFSLVTDAIAIRSRASVMAELVRESMLAHPDATKEGHLRWLSVACGTALPAMKAAVHAAIQPHLLLADFDDVALAQAERLAERVGFRGQVETRRMNIFDVAQMDSLGSDLARHGALPHLIDLMGIFEYTGANLGVDPVSFLASVFRILRPGGALILGQMLNTRPVPDFTMGVVPWPYVEMRSLDDLMRITTAAGLPSTTTELFLPSDGVYAVLRATKLT